MAGAGSFKAGTGGAGQNPITQATLVEMLRPQAIFFDPSTRGFPQDLDGLNVAVHPVDQSVAIIFGVFKGSILSAKDTGFDRARVKRATKAALQAAINDECARVLADLIGDGSVKFLGSPLRADAHGRPFFYVDYVNLRISPTEPKRRLPVFA